MSLDDEIIQSVNDLDEFSDENSSDNNEHSVPVYRYDSISTEMLKIPGKMKPLPQNITDALAASTKKGKKTKASLEEYGIITKHTARNLVRIFYIVQKDRVRIGNQIAASIKYNPNESTEILEFFHQQLEFIEAEIEKVLTLFYRTQDFNWFFEQTVGIGPILSASLLSNIDINKANTAGAIWKYAGLINDPWIKGKPRPWNADLKTTCWKIGQSFIKFTHLPNCHYGHIYKDIKAEYWNKNLNGDYSERARQISIDRDMDKLAIGKYYYLGKVDPIKLKADMDRVEQEKEQIRLEKARYKAQGLKVKKYAIPSIDINNVMNDKDASGHYIIGQHMLPPAHIDAMASRYAVKMFLAHLYEKWREWAKLPVAEPYVIAHQQHVHRHYGKQIPPKNR